VYSIYLVSRHTRKIILKQYLDAFEKQSTNCSIRIVDNLSEVLDDPSIAIAIVANAPDLHYSTACDLLCAGNHVLVEKPFVVNSGDAKKLLRIAKKIILRLCLDTR